MPGLSDVDWGEKDGRRRRACPEDPRKLGGQPIGQYHCPHCGMMCVAGLPHPSPSALPPERQDPRYPMDDYEDEYGNPWPPGYEDEPLVFPVGTVLACPFCGRALYKLVREVAVGAILPATHVERVEGVEEPTLGAAVACPEHGAVPVNFMLPFPSWRITVPTAGDHCGVVRDPGKPWPAESINPLGALWRLIRGR